MPGGPYSSAASASSNHSVRLSMSPYSGFLAKLSAKEDDSKHNEFQKYTWKMYLQQ